MQRLNKKRILVGITGGIAAYKTAELVRHLRKLGAEVHVVMTRAACEFITPLTLQALSSNAVHTDLLDPKAEAGMGHIELARWADVILVAPATADFMARLANGHGDDLLTTLCLATSAPLCLAPAMNQGMWNDNATRNNRQILEDRGIIQFGPAEGSQACGETGPGRMLEPMELIEHLARMFKQETLTGRRVIITAGPTREAIDPVRYISNHSSGKMGYALAEAAVEAGADVTLISGPVNRETPDRVTRVDVTSARDMHRAVHETIADCDIFISTAAVADYRPDTEANSKIKKDPDAADETLQLTLVRNPDIVASVAALEQKPFVVGFAAETCDVISYATDKLHRKKLDLIVANDVSDTSIGFNSDDNAVTVIGPDFEDTLPRTSKRQVARQLLDILAQHYHDWSENNSTREHHAQTESPNS
ncbi:bifunctional phosphopantothenoylcysteine decarboxylase/phosphopantothenate--cysteine ligase CoaBC [Kistimonas asteriae]|uniref:bifunctional phosphopantothenoylcysteine decarboxylase/phosphopantothenate--cysteine ligase CoaBC n=1 Tax=Kistimonas asteriae TaxID=517724 RepID=UPI001BAA0E72|nr:bifunctional phosphopantothenoylcysteine decarboxylase/phosphopantothenate--cysteine ligase CoaBC [Kistimonas asteriae]